jgi:hypothetical protein
VAQRVCMVTVGAGRDRVTCKARAVAEDRVEHRQIDITIQSRTGCQHSGR